MNAAAGAAVAVAAAEAGRRGAAVDGLLPISFACADAAEKGGNAGNDRAGIGGTAKCDDGCCC